MKKEKLIDFLRKNIAPGRVAESRAGLWVRCFLRSCLASLGLKGAEGAPGIVRGLLRPGGMEKAGKLREAVASPKKARQERTTNGSGLAVSSGFGLWVSLCDRYGLTEAAGEH